MGGGKRNIVRSLNSVQFRAADIIQGGVKHRNCEKKKDSGVGICKSQAGTGASISNIAEEREISVEGKRRHIWGATGSKAHSNSREKTDKSAPRAAKT